MARIHGRRGRIYMDITGVAQATPLPFFAEWSMNFTVDRAEVTAMEDSNKVYVSGLPDAQGDFSGFYDDSTVQTYAAATDGIARKIYIYPNTSNTGQYWFGTVLPDFSVNGGVAGAVQVKATWAAASAMIKVG